jgi:uncharacterized membrane protein
MRRIALIIVGTLLVAQSILVWASYFKGYVTLIDFGSWSIFFTAKISTLGAIVNIILFVLGVSALVWAGFYYKKKEKRPID